jgi:chromosome partitioning protein
MMHSTTSHVIVLANHKGGCAKTTTAANLAAALANPPIGKRVLLIDADPQANASELYGCEDARLPGLRLDDVLARAHWDQPPPVWTERPDLHEPPEPMAGGIHLLPCTQALEEVVTDLQVQDPENFIYRLRDAVDQFRTQYDYIILDTPPGLQALSSMALLAADWVIAPVRPADVDINGAVKLFQLIEQNIEPINPRLRPIGVLLTQVEKRWRLGHDTRAVLAQVGLPKIRREIPFAVRVGEAPRYMSPTIVHEPDGRVGAAYRDVAIELDAALNADHAA